MLSIVTESSLGQLADIRMCTACYSKMQREKKKGSMDGIYSERSSDDIGTDNHHFNVRGSRHASAAARKFIEEFARNKGGWEKTNGSQKRNSTHDDDLTTHQHSSRATRAASGTALATDLSVPKGTSEELFHLAQSCCAVGNKILRRDGRFATQQGMIHLSELSRSHQGAVDQVKSITRKSGPLHFSSTIPPVANSYRNEIEHPDVLQGAADLLHMMKDQSFQSQRVRSNHSRITSQMCHSHNRPALLLQTYSGRQVDYNGNQHDAPSPDACRGFTSLVYPCTRRSDLSLVCSAPVPGPGIAIDACSQDISFSSRSAPRHLIRAVHGHIPRSTTTIGQPYLSFRPTAYHCSRNDIA